jgi:hypothetical protein
MIRHPFGVFLFVAFSAVSLFAQTPATVTCPVGLTAGGPTGTYTATLTGATEGSLTATLDSTNTAVVTVPASVVIPNGASSFTFQVTPVGAGTADVGVTIGGTRRDCTVTVAAASAGLPGGPTLSATALVILALLLAATGLIVMRQL